MTEEVTPQTTGNETKAPETLVTTPPEPKGVTEKPFEKPNDAKEAPLVPEKYEFKLPEKSLLKPSQVDKIAAYAKEQGLSQDKAQALLERDNEALSSFVNEQNSDFENRKKAWVTEIHNDKELGGNNFNESIELSKRVIEKFGDAKFKEALNQTGLGNHPELVRFISRIGKIMAPDTLVVSSNTGGESKSFADKFYADSATKK